MSKFLALFTLNVIFWLKLVQCNEYMPGHKGAKRLSCYLVLLSVPPLRPDPCTMWILTFQQCGYWLVFLHQGISHLMHDRDLICHTHWWALRYQFGSSLEKMDHVAMLSILPMQRESKVHRANMGPTWGRQDPGGPHVGHLNLAIWDSIAPFWFEDNHNIS